MELVSRSEARVRLLEPCHSSHCEEHLGEPQWTERQKNPLIVGRVKEAGVIKRGKNGYSGANLLEGCHGKERFMLCVCTRLCVLGYNRYSQQASRKLGS